MNDHIQSCLQKNIAKHEGAKVVVGWFFNHQEGFEHRGDFQDVVPSDAIFQIGSVSKTFTASLISRIQQEGRLNLEDAIGLHLPLKPGTPASFVTVAQLLTHTSGLPSIPSDLLAKGYDRKNPYCHYTKERLLAYLDSYKKPLRPTKKSGYSNLGYGILGVLLEELTGKTYADLVNTLLCEPLKMTTTFQTKDQEPLPNRIAGYYKGKKVPWWVLGPFAGAGALESSAKDMLRYLRGNQKTGHLLSSSLTQCHLIASSYGKRSMGLGWMITDHKKLGRLHWHNGGTGGFNSYIALQKERNFGVVVLLNQAISFIHGLGMPDPAQRIGLQTMSILWDRLAVSS